MPPKPGEPPDTLWGQQRISTGLDYPARAGLTMTADGVLSAAMASTYVNKAGDVMNGPLRWANNGGVSRGLLIRTVQSLVSGLNQPSLHGSVKSELCVLGRHPPTRS